MFAHAWRILCLLVYYLTIPFISVTGAWIIWDQGRVTSECIRSAPEQVYWFVPIVLLTGL